MIDFFKKMFAPERSSETAKERLRLVLISDQLALAPEVVEALKNDLFAVISRYVEIDSSQADLTFEHRDREIAMLASIPIIAVRDRSRELVSAGSRTTSAAETSNRPVAAQTHVDPLEETPLVNPAPVPSDSVRYINGLEQPREAAPESDVLEPDPHDGAFEAFDFVAAPAPAPHADTEPASTIAPEPAASHASAPARSSNAAVPRRKRRRKSASAAAAAAAKPKQQMPPGSTSPELGSG